MLLCLELSSDLVCVLLHLCSMINDLSKVLCYVLCGSLFITPSLYICPQQLLHLLYVAEKADVGELSILDSITKRSEWEPKFDKQFIIPVFGSKEVLGTCI